MPLVDTATLLRVADRAAYQYGQLKTVFGAISQEGLGYYFDTVTATDDPDVEIPTEPVYEEVDDDLEPGFAAKYGTRLPGVIGGMDAHFVRRDANGNYLQVGGWDGYLYDNDVRVSQYFGELYFAVIGRYMHAVNVFSEGDDEFAELEVVSGPSVQFTDGINYGNGAVTNPADGSNFAATQLKVEVVTMGGTDLDLRLSVKDVNDNPTTIDVTVPGGSAPGAVVNVGGTSDRFLDVIGAGFVPAGSTGTVGDTVKVKNLKERQIQL